MQLREISPTGKLSNLQMELLKVFHQSLSDEQLLEIRGLLAGYFLKKADEELERLENENGWTEDTYKSWANEHWRERPTK